MPLFLPPNWSNPNTLFGSDYWGQVTTTIEALGKLGDKRAVEPLIHILSDERLFDFHNSLMTTSENNALVFTTIEALGNLGDRRATKPIIDASERWLEQELKDLKSWENFGSSDSAKMLQNTSFGGSSDYTKNLLEKYNHDKKLVQDALTRLNVQEKGSKAGNARIGEAPQAVGDNHKQAVQHVQVGIDLIKSQQWDQAILELKKAVKIEPNFAKAHQLLAIAYGGKMDRESAIKHYQLLRTLDPSMAKELEDNPLFALILNGGVIQL